jgi:ATP-dependent Zn protease
LKSAYERAKNIVTTYRDTHEKIALVLLEKEEMLATEFDAFFTDIIVPEKTVM